MILIKNGEVFAPEPLGVCDILIGGESILHISGSIDPQTIPGEIDTLDATGMLVTPGFIDGHQHFTGGGGEGGFHTRTPEMTLSMNIDNGVTTAVGLLGTDGYTRSVEALFAKTEAFNHEGITAYMLTGSYWVPSPTITGTIGRDLSFIKPVIGLKIALADNRGAVITPEKLATLALETRNAALIAGKPGIITVHMGAKQERLSHIFEAIERYDIHTDTFVPTHINRKDKELESQVLALAEKGATVDATCLNRVPGNEDKHQSAADFACNADNAGLFDKVTFSSDAGGSLPQWDKEMKNIIGMGIGTPESLSFELNQLVNSRLMSMAKGLRPLTTTPAKLYGLDKKKGALKKGIDADILLIHSENMKISGVVAKGKVVKMNDQVIQKGYFEK